MDKSEELEKLERQLLRGTLFNHTINSEHAERIAEVEGFLYGLIDLLITKGVTVPETLKQSVEKVKKEMYENNDYAQTGIALRLDGKENVDPPVINCAERMHICHAICCSLRFALNQEEIEKGVVKWDLGIPYFIRHEKNGSCTHKCDDGKCSIYNERPKVCSDYTCQYDDRIWKDFDKMELNQEWLDENLKPTEPKLITEFDEILMHDADEIVNKIEEK